jgi:Bacterial regulatory helix-turn-helix protein, lysR family
VKRQEPTTSPSSHAAEEATTRSELPSTKQPQSAPHPSTSHGAWNRPHRFAAAAEHRTIGGAATALGLTASTLVTQINRLERDLGGQLLTRAARGQPMLLTPLGKKVVATIRKHSSEEMPRS